MKEFILSFVLVLMGIAQAAYGQTIPQEIDSINESVVELYKPHIYNDMPYRIMKPVNFDPDMSYPVIVSLHGEGGRGTDNLKQLRDWNYVLAEQQRRTDYPAYILAPQSTGMWNTIHIQNIKDIITDLPSVDMNRIYILCHTMGGAGTYGSYNPIRIILRPGEKIFSMYRKSRTFPSGPFMATRIRFVQ